MFSVGNQETELRCTSGVKPERIRSPTELIQQKLVLRTQSDKEKLKLPSPPESMENQEGEKRKKEIGRFPPHKE